MSRISLTYGRKPPRHTFEENFKAACPMGTYNIGNHRRSNTAMHDGDFDCDELWSMVLKLIRQYDRGNEMAGEDASVLLETLDIEWV